MKALFLSCLTVIFALVSTTALYAVDENGPAGDSLTDAPTQAGELPADLVEVVWNMIDTDKNSRGTDREVAAAIKPLRVKANVKVASDLRDKLQMYANTDDNPIVTIEEATRLVAKVRGQQCPTAKRAKEFFKTMDSDGDGTIVGKEIAAVLSPLGNVGGFLAVQLSPKFKAMDLDRSKAIDIDEAYYSANSLLRFQLATEGAATARRSPKDWFRYVNAIAYLDVDADNRVSRQEAGGVESVANAFTMLDLNKDKQVTLTEMCTYKTQLDLSACSGG